MAFCTWVFSFLQVPNLSPCFDLMSLWRSLVSFNMFANVTSKGLFIHCWEKKGHKGHWL